jgi:CPA2 family monovalent cation:H+ antiporter-2
VDGEAENLQPRLHSLVLPPGAAAVGRALKELDFAALGVEVTATRRRNLRSSVPDPDTLLAEGDVLVLRGTQDALEAADMYLMQGTGANK